MIRVTEVSNKDTVRREIYKLQKTKDLKKKYDKAFVTILQNSWPPKQKFVGYIESLVEQGVDDSKLVSMAFKKIMKETGCYDFDVYELFAKRFDISDNDLITSNPYYKNVYFDDVQSGGFKLAHDSFSKWEIVMEDSINDEFDVPKLALCKEYVEYPVVMTANNNTWMSITQNEINTMEKVIDNAHGRVLVLGMGMSYYPYMISQKDNVESITIVEINKNCIELNREYILPKFPDKEIDIVHMHAFEYLEQLKECQFDYCFADIISSANDTDRYTLTQQLLNCVPGLEYDLWLEDVEASGYAREIANILINDGKSYSDMANSLNLTHPAQMAVIDAVASSMPSVETAEQVRKLTSIDYVKKIARQLKLPKHLLRWK